MARGTKENRRAAGPYNPNYADKYLRVDFTIEDPGTFTTPWNAVMIYLRDRAAFPEQACAEGRMGFHNDEGALSMLANRPFPGDPPRFIRAERYRYRFTKPGEGHGAWWVRTRIGAYLPPLSRTDDSVREFLMLHGWLPERRL